MNTPLLKTSFAMATISFLVDTDRQVRFVRNGVNGNDTKEKYREEIESLLKGKP